MIATGETCSPTGPAAQPDFPAYNGFQRKIEQCVGFITKLDNALDIYIPAITAAYADPPAVASNKFFFSEFFGGQPPAVASGGWYSNRHYLKNDVISVLIVDSTGLVSSVAEKCIASGTSGAVQPNWSTTGNSVTNDGTVVWQNMGAPQVLINATTIARSVATDPLDDIFVVGGSDSDFIGCAICGDTSYYVGAGAWILKVNKMGGWVYSTVLGTTKTDTANAVVVDGSGHAYVAGMSTGGIFLPSNTTTFHGSTSGGQDAFVFQLDTAGTSIIYAGYLGGSGDDSANAIAVDLNGSAYIAGSTKSPDFPVVNPLTNPTSYPPNAPMEALSGPEDAFIARIIPSGASISFASYFGGSGADHAQAIAVHQSSTGSQDMYVAGATLSTDFPVYADDPAVTPLQTSYTDNGDAFVAMIPGNSLVNVLVSPANLGFGSQTVTTTSSPLTVTFTNTGNIPITISKIEITPANSDFKQTNNCPATALLTNASCTVTVTFSPKAAGAETATLWFYDNGNNSPQSIPLGGTGTTLNGGNPLTVSPSGITFGDQAQTTTSTVKTVTVTNIGSSSVPVAISVTGDFIQTNTCSANLATAGTCVVSVTFKPTASGARTGTLTVTSGSYDQAVTLAGNGTAAPTPDFTLSGAGNGVTTSVGGSSTFSISLAPAGGFSQTVSLTCAAPAPATCTFNPDSVAMDGTTTKAATASVNVPAGSKGGSSPNKGASLRWMDPFGALPFCAGITLIGVRRKRNLMILLLIVALALMFAFTACSGGGSTSSSTGMTPGSYNLTVTATSGTGTSAVTHTMTVQMTVTN